MFGTFKGYFDNQKWRFFLRNSNYAVRLLIVGSKCDWVINNYNDWYGAEHAQHCLKVKHDFFPKAFVYFYF